MAPRSDEAAAWFAAVYQAVQEIPVGRVTSYGHIARLVGKRESRPPGRTRRFSRLTNVFIEQLNALVGVCLKHLPSDTEQGGGDNGDDNGDDSGTRRGPRWHSGNVPWQRVINSKGAISPRGPAGASRQAAALRREGVHVGRGSLGEYLVDLAVYGWFPNELPSEEAAVESSSSDESGHGAEAAAADE